MNWWMDGRMGEWMGEWTNGVLRRVIWKLESKRAELISPIYRSRKRFHTSSFRIREIRACIIAVAFRTSGRVSDRDEFMTNLQKGTPEKRVNSFAPSLHLFTARLRNKTGTSTRFIDFSLTLSNSILSV